jgi:hypothetical protein
MTFVASIGDGHFDGLHLEIERFQQHFELSRIPTVLPFRDLRIVDDRNRSPSHFAIAGNGLPAAPAATDLCAVMQSQTAF